MKKIKIGQIGIGHNHGEAKMLAVRKFPELFEVVGYAEESDEWVEKRGGLGGYAGLSRMSVEKLLSACDAVLVESDVWNLTKYAHLCIDAGKHIHMDKPASGTLAEFKELLSAAKQKALTVQMGYMYRYNPAIKKCLAMIRNGELGEIYSINAEMSTFHSPEYKRWLTNFGGGIMYILGSHMVDLIVYILGAPQKVTPFLKRTGLDGIDFEDNDLAVLEYEKALARIYVSSVEVNGWGRRQFVVSGSKGTVNIMPIENDCTMTYANLETSTLPYEDRKETVAVRDVPKHCRYDEMMRDFYDYILGNKINPFSYEHDYTVQKVLSDIVGGIRVYPK